MCLPIRQVAKNLANMPTFTRVLRLKRQCHHQVVGLAGQNKISNNFIRKRWPMKIVKNLCLCLLLNILSFPSFAAQDKDLCNQKTQELGNILLSINRKIVAMPPLATIYASTSNVWDKARSARDSGNYQECIRLNDIGISTAGSYAR